ncbi:MAG: PadR family transcriptional regulator [Vicinamibacterales bacterium]
MAKEADPDHGLLQGTLDLLLLRALRLEPLHGYGVTQRLGQITEGTCRFQAGSVFPALYRLEREGVLKSHWARTESGRRAKYYALTAAGRRKLEREQRNWERIALAVARVIDAT